MNPTYSARFSEMTGLYRNKHNRWLAGVCSGIADRLDLSVLWIRIGVIIALCAFSVVTALIYVALIFLMQPRDYKAYAPQSTNYRAASTTPPALDLADMDFRLLQARFERLDSRLGGIESTIIADELALRRKFKDLDNT